MAYGYVTYPGVNTVLSFDITDISGITPSRALMEIVPQDEVPAANGDINVYYTDDDGGSYHITLANMHLDAANYERNSGGKVVMLHFLDERWEWAFNEISGRYNIKIARCYDSAFAAGAATEFVDPDHEKNPQELAQLLIQAMGYADDDWDYSVLPTDPRPLVNWDYDNPAQELARLADQFGCRIVPVRSAGTWSLVKAGEGADLPEEYPFMDPGDGIDPVESPGYLKIATAPLLYECRLKLEDVAKDVDTLYYPTTQVSYCPVVDNQFASGVSTFAYSDREFWDISNFRIRMPDESLISPQELAQQTVYKCFKIAGASSAIRGGTASYSIPGFKDAIDIKQIILTENRVLAQISEGSTTVQPLRSFIEGIFYDDRKPADTGNYPLGTRLDLALQSERYLDDYDVSYGFSIANSDDVRYAMISFNSQVRSFDAAIPALIGDANATQESEMLPPELYLHTAIQIRDPDSWQPIRDERYRWIGTGDEPSDGPDTPGVSVRAILKPDIQPWYRGVYLADGTLTETIDNHEFVTRQCDAYLDDLEQFYEVVANARRRYIGLFPIDMSGTIQQVSYRISSGGFDTTASQNTEHDFELPTYEDRRAREARRNPANKEAVTSEIREELTRRGIVGK